MLTRRLQFWDGAHKLAALFVLVCLSFSASSHAVGPPPVITAQPLDTVAVNGGTATFTVTATSGTTLSYQWYKDGLLILDQLLVGETRSSLVLSGVSSADEGNYFVKVSNAGGTVTSRKASLTTVPNSPPVAGYDHYFTTEDVPLIVPAQGVLANDSDVNNQPLVAVLMTNVTQGNLTLNTNGAFSYTPPTNFSGNVSFTYRVADGHPVLAEQNEFSLGSTEIRLDQAGAQSFQHGAIGGDSYMINKVVLYLSKKSGGSGNLNFSIGSGINSGAVPGSTVPISSASITNTSEGGSFQTYAITYNPPVGPFAAGTTYYLNFTTASAARFYLSRSMDTYGCGTYYEKSGDQKTDLRFQVYETLMSNPATVTINVNPIDDPPVAVNDTKNALEDTSVTIKPLANDYDPEGSPVTLTGVYTTNGSAAISGSNIVFQASTNYSGTVVLNYTISDGLLSATGRVTVAVAPVNDAPVAGSDAFATPKDTTLTVPAAGVLANDFDVDNTSLDAWLLTDVSHGSLVLNLDGSFTYTPHAGYVGPDSFTYEACDGPDDSPPTTVTINVVPVSAPLQIRSGQMLGKGFELHLSGPEGSFYVIQASSDNTRWTPIATNYAANGSLQFTDPDAVNHPMRFYRAHMLDSRSVVVQPAP